MRFVLSNGLVALAILTPVVVFADSPDNDWCQKAAKDFVDVAYKPGKDGSLDNGHVESEILDKFVKEGQTKGSVTVTDRMANRALYLRSRTNTPKSEALTDVASLCASLTSGGGHGRSRVSYGDSVDPNLADREAAWDKYYRPRTQCDNPTDWEVTVECGNERMRARAEFDKMWSRGDFSPKRK